MRKSTIILVLIISIAVIFLFSKYFLKEKTAINDDWELVWHDEFNKPNINSNKWNILLREHSKHNELQYYHPDEILLENGFLRIRSRKNKFGSKKYTSGRLNTKSKFHCVYGRFEIRAKLPFGKGLWPAYWLYPQNRNWQLEKLMKQAVDNGEEHLIPEIRPWYSEIDIMEFLGHEPNKIYGTLHYYTFDGQQKAYSGEINDTIDYSKEFHTYAIEWEPDSIRWYVDDQLFHMTTIGIPHTPHFLILNTAIGGTWPGDPDSITIFPQFHDIDYVRIYKKRGV